MDFPSLAAVLERLDFRTRGRTEKNEELIDRAPCITLDGLSRQLQAIAQKQPDLHVAGDEPEKGAERLLGVLEGENAGRPARFEQRLHALSDGEAPIGKHDGAQ